MLKQKQLPGFTPVPSSLASGVTTTVTCKLDPGVRAHVLWLQFGNDGTTNPGQGLGTLKANGMIAEIRLLWGGKVQRRPTAVELNAINALNNDNGSTKYSAKTYGTASSAGFRTLLPIFLAEPFRKGQVVTTGGRMNRGASKKQFPISWGKEASARVKTDLDWRSISRKAIDFLEKILSEKS